MNIDRVTAKQLREPEQVRLVEHTDQSLAVPDSAVQTDSPEWDEAVRNIGDRYEIISTLGRGGMGHVYKVKDLKLEQHFAVKLINPHLMQDQGAIKRFQQEARAACNLTHPNICTVYEFGIGAHGAPYLVMDLLSGCMLSEIIEKEGYLNAPRAIDIFIQIAEAVSYAHQNGVIHRDIKPGNILLEPNGHGNDLVKLIDFGIAKVLPDGTQTAESLTQTGELFGSCMYMSPEQCEGNDVDARSDIYAIGCVMYEILTGRPPFAGSNPIQTVLRHISEDPLPFAALRHDYAIPEDLERIVMCCLTKSPNNRYQTASDLVRHLKLVRDGQKINWLASNERKMMLLRNVSVFVIGLAISMLVFSQWQRNTDKTDSVDAPASVPLAEDRHEPSIPIEENVIPTADLSTDERYSWLRDVLSHPLREHTPAGIEKMSTWREIPAQFAIFKGMADPETERRQEAMLPNVPVLRAEVRKARQMITQEKYSLASKHFRAALSALETFAPHDLLNKARLIDAISWSDGQPPEVNRQRIAKAVEQSKELAKIVDQLPLVDQEEFIEHFDSLGSELQNHLFLVDAVPRESRTKVFNEAEAAFRKAIELSNRRTTYLADMATAGQVQAREKLVALYLQERRFDLVPKVQEEILYLRCERKHCAELARAFVLASQACKLEEREKFNEARKLLTESLNTYRGIVSPGDQAANPVIAHYKKVLESYRKKKSRAN